MLNRAMIWHEFQMDNVTNITFEYIPNTFVYVLCENDTDELYFGSNRFC